MTLFGQVVIGPPGSGKSTYCRGVREFLTALGRKVAIVNLDPANDNLPYECEVNIFQLITLQDVMDRLKLGPNGGLIYCIEFLQANIEWLKSEVMKLKGCYILFDCPGQVELYTHQDSLKTIFAELGKWDVRLVATHLVDSHYCSDPGKFISVLLTSLATMLQVELPHINVLSKIDLIEKMGKLALNIDFYTEVLDMSYLLGHLADDPFFQQYKRLNSAIVGLVEDYSLVSFTTLDIQNKESVMRVVRLADKANGYCFGDLEERNLQKMLSCAFGETEFEYENNDSSSEAEIHKSNN